MFLKVASLISLKDSLGDGFVKSVGFLFTALNKMAVSPLMCSSVYKEVLALSDGLKERSFSVKPSVAQK